jgi:DNA-binding NarL/FixJ family response regulator
MVNVYLLSPSPAVRLGLRALLEPLPSIQVIGEAANLEQTSKIPIDVLVYAPMYAASAGIEFLSDLIGEGTALLILTEDFEAVRQFAGLPLRAWGILSPSCSADELAAAVQALNEGFVILDALAAKKLVSFSPKLSLGEELLEPLTERESEVLQLLAQGLANKQIAARLNLSTHTVKYHMASIYSKLGASNRTEAVRLGLQKGLVSL